MRTITRATSRPGLCSALMVAAALAACGGSDENPGTTAASTAMRTSSKPASAPDGRLSAAISIKPEMAAVLHEQGEEVPEQPPFVLALLAGEGDKYVVDEGPAKGMTGYFTRASDGSIDGVHMGGRLATRTATVPA